MKPKILLSGSHLAKDNSLVELLEEKMEVVLLQDLSRLEASVGKSDLVLVILELSEAWEDELALMHSLRANHPRLLFIAVNGGGEREVIIRSFHYGANDFFKKPYEARLLAERVEALIKAKETMGNEKR